MPRWIIILWFKAQTMIEEMHGEQNAISALQRFLQHQSLCSVPRLLCRIVRYRIYATAGLILGKNTPGYAIRVQTTVPARICRKCPPNNATCFSNSALHLCLPALVPYAHLLTT